MAIPLHHSTLNALDALGALIALVGAEGRVSWINAALLEVGGARRWLGQPLAELLDQPQVTELLQRARQSLEATLARRLSATLDGQRAQPVDLRVIPLADADQLLVELQLSTTPGADAGGDFGRMVAHEVRNPLGAIRGAAQLLARSAQGSAETELAQLIVEETARIDALVAQLHGGPSVSRPVPINVHRVTEHVAQLIEAEFGTALSLRRDYDPSLPDLPLDHPRLVQALLNLVRNAVQAGAARVTIRTRADHHQRIAGQMQRLVVRIEVEDDGPGISPELQSRITQAGFSARSGGSGLGLTVVQSVAAEHGGELSFDSRPGVTRFRLQLPWRADEHAP